MAKNIDIPITIRADASKFMADLESQKKALTEREYLFYKENIDKLGNYSASMGKSMGLKEIELKKELFKEYMDFQEEYQKEGIKQLNAFITQFKSGQIDLSEKELASLKKAGQKELNEIENQLMSAKEKLELLDLGKSAEDVKAILEARKEVSEEYQQAVKGVGSREAAFTQAQKQLSVQERGDAAEIAEREAKAQAEKLTKNMEDALKKGDIGGAIGMKISSKLDPLVSKMGIPGGMEGLSAGVAGGIELMKTIDKFYLSFQNWRRDYDTFSRLTDNNWQVSMSTRMEMNHELNKSSKNLKMIYHHNIESDTKIKEDMMRMMTEGITKKGVSGMGEFKEFNEFYRDITAASQAFGIVRDEVAKFGSTLNREVGFEGSTFGFFASMNRNAKDMDMSFKEYFDSYKKLYEQMKKYGVEVEDVNEQLTDWGGALRNSIISINDITNWYNKQQTASTESLAQQFALVTSYLNADDLKKLNIEVTNAGDVFNMAANMRGIQIKQYTESHVLLLEMMTKKMFPKLVEGTKAFEEGVRVVAKAINVDFMPAEQRRSILKGINLRKELHTQYEKELELTESKRDAIMHVIKDLEAKKDIGKLTEDEGLKLKMAKEDLAIHAAIDAIKVIQETEGVGKVQEWLAEEFQKKEGAAVTQAMIPEILKEGGFSEEMKKIIQGAAVTDFENYSYKLKTIMDGWNEIFMELELGFEKILMKMASNFENFGSVIDKVAIGLDKASKGFRVAGYMATGQFKKAFELSTYSEDSSRAVLKDKSLAPESDIMDMYKRQQ